MVNLKQIKITLLNLGIDASKIDDSISSLEQMREDLNAIPVQGRDIIDNMLGCMMGIEQILGKE